jgi:hypothetical protein
MRLWLWTALAVSAPLVGCTGAVSEPAGPGDAEGVAMSTSAVVIVERGLDTTGALRAETSARFIRVPSTSSTQEALRAIGATVDLPPAGSCASIASLAGGATQATSVPVVELVDVGAVALDTTAGETRLVPRQLPDVTDVVSGVVYARTADPTLLPSVARYVVHVAGALDVEPFDVAATAPADPTDVRIAREDTSGLSVPGGAAIELAWPEDASDDVLYVDVQPAAYRCTLDAGSAGPSDRTRASVPASLVDEDGTLVVHRVHREALSVRGLESAELRFDFSRSVSYVRR